MSTATVLEIVIPAWPPSELRANKRQQTHWAKRRKVADDWLWLVRHALTPNMSQIPPQPWAHAHAKVEFLFPDSRRRDLENFFVGLKETWDYFIHLGIIADDHWENLTFSLEGRLNKALAPMTFITLTKGTDDEQPGLPVFTDV